ncbi:protein of unknown function [Acidithiobacillus ferrivorans]|uniref:Uncharacterized protein n=1 Tax=Acidithiobacillus ferrivorans TaxID=160808 RepID=A0ABY1MQQ0_9PROT|nr:protein of unknown function [Acidithiobacillus ferrivorans]
MTTLMKDVVNGQLCQGVEGAASHKSLKCWLLCQRWRTPTGAKSLDKEKPELHNAPLIVGGVPERLKGSDCKSDGSAFGGSNPPPSTI